jgi:hypothetical protein
MAAAIAGSDQMYRGAVGPSQPIFPLVQAMAPLNFEPRAGRHCIRKIQSRRPTGAEGRCNGGRAPHVLVEVLQPHEAFDAVDSREAAAQP